MEFALLTYLLVKRHKDSSITLVSERTNDGARSVCVFDEPVKAETFLILENLVEDLGCGWKVVECAPLVAAELLEACADDGARYIVLNPPSALTRGEEEALLIPIWGFVNYLLGK